MIKSALLVTVIFSIVNAHIVNAEVISCGLVTNKVIFLKKDEYKLILADENGRFLNKNTKRVLPSGPQKLMAKIVVNNSSTYVNPNLNNFNADQFSEPIEFTLNVKANTHYQLVAMKTASENQDKKRTFQIVIKKETTKVCQSNTLSKKMKDRFAQSTKLPSELQYRLDLVMKDIKQYLQQQESTKKTVVFDYSRQVITTLGAVVETKKPSKKGIKVLAITPFSLAAKIGILPNDIIVSLNQQEFSSSNSDMEEVAKNVKIFKAALSNVLNDETFVIEVYRNNILQELIVNVKDVTLPSYRLSIQVN